MTLTKLQLDSIAAEMGRSGILSALKVLEPFQEKQWICGVAVVAGEPTKLCVALDGDFPTSLPQVFLGEDWTRPFVPHLMLDWLVCWAEAGTLRWDSEDMTGIVREAIRGAVRTLEDGLSKRNHGDFQDEFESYWSFGYDDANCYLGPGQSVRSAVANQGKDGVLQIGSRATLVRLGVAQSWEELEPVIFVPLEGAIRPPRWNEVWTADDVRTLLCGVPVGERHKLDELAHSELPPRLHVVFQIDRAAGGESLVGVSLTNRWARSHPFRFGAEGWRTRRVKLNRADPEYLAARGGAHRELLVKSVLLVGCGAVGGHLAFELARAGIGRLTLVDSQKLALENIYRHVLGWRYARKHKASALKTAILENLPFTDVIAVDKSLKRALADGDFRTSDFDLVVIAVGDPVVELDVNRLLWEREGGRAVFAWVEPLGLGGHAIRIAGRRRGCLECTFRPIAEGGDSVVSFAAPGQDFSRKLTGCGSSFTPYGSADAVQTAMLASRLAVQALLEADAPPQVSSWRGTDASLAGYQVSARWKENGMLTVDGDEFAQECCSVCGLTK